MRINELKKEITQAIQKHTAIIEELSGADNPQIQECEIYHTHILETLQSVLARIDGNRIALTFL